MIKVSLKINICLPHFKHLFGSTNHMKNTKLWFIPQTPGSYFPKLFLLHGNIHPLKIFNDFLDSTPLFGKTKFSAIQFSNEPIWEKN